MYIRWYLQCHSSDTQIYSATQVTHEFTVPLKWHTNLQFHSSDTRIYSSTQVTHEYTVPLKWHTNLKKRRWSFDFLCKLVFTEYLKNYKEFTQGPIQLRYYFLVKKWQTRQRTFCNPKRTACLFIRLPSFCSKTARHVTLTYKIGIRPLHLNFIFVTSIQGSHSFQIDFLKVPAFQQTRRSTFGVTKRLEQGKKLT
jgi:hypothetical protein